MSENNSIGQTENFNNEDIGSEDHEMISNINESTTNPT